MIQRGNMAFINKNDVTPMKSKVWLASPTMHGRELVYMREAFETNWMSTIGANIDAVEKEVEKLIGVKHAVALCSGTAALHLAARLAAERLYGRTPVNVGMLSGKKVFASDVTFSATVNPIAYEGGESVFIDTERGTWNMDPEALEKAFELFPEVKLVVLAHLYGTPGKIAEIRDVCRRHGALIIEDAAESVGAVYCAEGSFRQTGSFGDFNCISFNGNKIITGSSGGMFLTDSAEDAEKIRKWSTQSRERAPWYQHEELGNNYRMSNVIAGVLRGQLPHLEEHIAQKRAIWERYREGFKSLPVKMNPFDEGLSRPNFWLSCMTIDEEAMCPQTRGDTAASYVPERGKSCPTEILETLAAFNIEGRPIWKPMHLQPIYRDHAFVTVNGFDAGRGGDVGSDIFRRGLCLPSDNKMREEQQNVVIELVKRCFD